MHIQFCGAAGEVTGSCTRLDVENATLLVDCGLFQGQKYSEDKNFDPFPFKADEIDAVLLTHAHLDHCGRLPKLINQGYTGKIYATDATRDITALILLDSAGIMEDEAERHNHAPLFTEEDVIHTMERFVTLPYGREVQVATGVTAKLFNAGHVLGSSFIAVKGEGKTVIFSGDIGNHPVPLLPEAAELPQANAMVLESTYGDRAHESFGEGVQAMTEAIQATVRDKGVLLIPAFSLERTQELLATIDELLQEHKIPELSAYLDGPLGIKISRIYEEYDHYFSDDAKAEQKQDADHDLLQFPSLTYTETAEQSKMIADVDPPKMIIAGSGMMHGGRILHHLKRYLPLPNTRLLIVGYQANGTLGRILQDGATHVKIHGEDIMVKAQIISTHGFSSHMDKDQLVDWIKTMPQPPQAIFLNHGDDDARAMLSQNLQALLPHCKIEVPAYTAGFTL